MNYIKITSGLVVLLTMVSCSTTQRISRLSEYTATYVGKTHNDIVLMVGVPTRQVSDGAGGTILCYEESVQRTVATAENVNPISGTYTPGALTGTQTSYVNFYINKEGICYNVDTNHTKLVTVESEVDPANVPKNVAKGLLIGAGGVVAVYLVMALLTGGF